MLEKIIRKPIVRNITNSISGIMRNRHADVTKTKNKESVNPDARRKNAYSVVYMRSESGENVRS